MKKFFYPKNIAVAGASPDRAKVSNNIIANLLEMGFEGGIFPVNRNGGEVYGYKIYRSLNEIPEAVDLLVIMVPAAGVPDLLEDAGKAGIDRAVIISDGFNESGKEGIRLARKTKEVAERYSIRFIGPNCQGIICADSGVCVPFAPLFRHQVKKGHVSIVNQSGSIGWITASVLSYEMTGISKVASIGNKLDVEELDLLNYLIEDPETRIIVLYLESFSDGRKLVEYARRSAKPIIVLKSNISGKASQIALSHTAALASDDRVTDAALAQAGIVRAYTLREMLEMCKAFSLPMLKGRNVAVMAGSGGLALIGEDTVQRQGLGLARLSEDLLREIADMGAWKRRNITNPVDLGGFFNTQDILNAVERILSQVEVGGAALSLFRTKEYDAPLTCSEFVDQIEGTSKRHSKPIALHFVSDFFPLAEMKMAKGFPIFDTMEDAVAALSVQWRYWEFLNRVRSPYRSMKKERQRVRQLLARSTITPLHTSDIMTMKLIDAYGIGCEMPVMAAELEEARLRAGEIGYPVVMKICSPDISHKTDVHGVKVNITDEKGLDEAFHDIVDEIKKSDSSCRIYGVLLQRMIPQGMELIIGGRYDNDFGPVIMFGMGGIFVEALDDVSFRLAPICREEAYEMMEEIKGFSILKGLRGKKAFDIASIADALERVSILLSDFPEIKELDLNPVKVFNDRHGLIVLDGRVKIGK